MANKYMEDAQNRKAQKAKSQAPEVVDALLHTQYTQRTQRKQKHPRINMAFYDDNLEYVREAAYQERMSATEYVNKLIKEDRQRKALMPEYADGKLRPDGQLKGQLSLGDVE